MLIVDWRHNAGDVMDECRRTVKVAASCYERQILAKENRLINNGRRKQLMRSYKINYRRRFSQTQIFIGLCRTQNADSGQKAAHRLFRFKLGHSLSAQPRTTWRGASPQPGFVRQRWDDVINTSQHDIIIAICNLDQSRSIAEYLLRRFQNFQYGEPPAPVSDEDKLRRELWLKTEEQFQNKVITSSTLICELCGYISWYGCIIFTHVFKTKDHHLPKIIGIGTEKCGTFALFNFLRPHPMIRMGRELPPELKDDPFVGDLEIEAHFFNQRWNGHDLKPYL